MKTLVYGLGLMLLMGIGVAQAKMPEVGAPAPAFRLQDQQGQWHSLADYRGHWLVLYFYPKDDTPGCTTEACHFRDDIVTLQGMGVKVVGVSVDGTASHAKFAEKYKLPFTLLSDPGGKVASSYDSLFSLFGLMKFAKRHTFIIDPDGHVAKIYTDVDPKTHTAQVAAALKELIAARGG
ncbi:MAG: peroxiredoxin [Gammaproteobacteria bacterium]|jgi:peroxiredoxin Q/BCP